MREQPKDNADNADSVIVALLRTVHKLPILTSLHNLVGITITTAFANKGTAELSELLLQLKRAESLLVRARHFYDGRIVDSPTLIWVKDADDYIRDYR